MPDARRIVQYVQNYYFPGHNLLLSTRGHLGKNVWREKDSKQFFWINAKLSILSILEIVSSKIMFSESMISQGINCFHLGKIIVFQRILRKLSGISEHFKTINSLAKQFSELSTFNSDHLGKLFGGKENRNNFLGSNNVLGSTFPILKETNGVSKGNSRCFSKFSEILR